MPTKVITYDHIIQSTKPTIIEHSQGLTFIWGSIIIKPMSNIDSLLHILHNPKPMWELGIQ